MGKTSWNIWMLPNSSDSAYSTPTLLIYDVSREVDGSKDHLVLVRVLRFSRHFGQNYLAFVAN